MTGETELDHVQQHDCEDYCGHCYVCLNECCPNCLALLVTVRAGDESYRKCPDCKYEEH